MPCNCNGICCHTHCRRCRCCRVRLRYQGLALQPEGGGGAGSVQRERQRKRPLSLLRAAEAAAPQASALTHLGQTTAHGSSFTQSGAFGLDCWFKQSRGLLAVTRLRSQADPINRTHTCTSRPAQHSNNLLFLCARPVSQPFNAQALNELVHRSQIAQRPPAVPLHQPYLSPSSPKRSMSSSTAARLRSLRR